MPRLNACSGAELNDTKAAMRGLENIFESEFVSPQQNDEFQVQDIDKSEPFSRAALGYMTAPVCGRCIEGSDPCHLTCWSRQAWNIKIPQIGS